MSGFGVILVRIFPHSDGIRENADQNNSKYRHFSRSVDDLLKRDKTVSIHRKYLQTLVTRIYKAKNNLGPEIMKDIFHFIQKPYNLRNDPELQRRRGCTHFPKIRRSAHRKITIDLLCF